MSKHVKAGLLNLLIIFIIASCAATATPEPGARDATDTPQPTMTPEPAATAAAESDGAAATQAARRALAERLDTVPAEIIVSSVEEMEWPDACLGLAEAGEMCAQVITPGYLVILTAEDRVYEVRTDREGTAARFQETVDRNEDYPAAVLEARMALASELGVEVEHISVGSFERSEWSNACLELAGPGEMCAQVITPGYLVILGAQGEMHEVHTNANGEQVRIADVRGRESGPAAGGATDVVVILKREGGIAGEMSEWHLHPSGTVEMRGDAAARGGARTKFQVEPARVDSVVTELKERGFFDLETSYMPENTCCDRFTYTLTAIADGQRQTVRAMEGTEETPEAFWQSIAVVRQAIEEATGAGLER